MSEQAKCSCGSAPKVIFSCSGSADVGGIADQAARKLTKDGAGRMSCLAGISGTISGIVVSAQSAAKILVIDACPLNCARKTMEQAGFTKFEHLCMADIGFVKGASPVTDENITKVAQKAAILLAC